MPITFDTGLVRPLYFDRQQLTAADLMAEQTYFRERLRRHNRFLHGWGVVCGATLSVEVNDDGSIIMAVVRPGYVVTPRGEELYLPPGVALDISEGIRACLPSAEPCAHPDEMSGRISEPQDAVAVDLRALPPGPGPNPRVVDGVSFQVFNYDGTAVQETTIATWGAFAGLNCGFGTEIVLPVATTRAVVEVATFASAVEVTARNVDGSIAERASTEPNHQPPEALDLRGLAIKRLSINAPNDETLLLRLAYFETTVADVYLAVRPFDKLGNPAPAVPDKCAPPGGTYEYSRVCEMAEFALLCGLPASHQQPEPTCEDLAAVVCGQRRAPCPPDPPTPEDDYVVLARLQVLPNGRIQSIDGLHVRRLLSESLQLAYLRCLCETVPAPVAAFDAEPQSGAPPLDVQFVDASSGAIDTWQWSFGDGSSSTAQHPSHRYTTAGIYTVSLTVAGPGGSDTATKTNFITVIRTLSPCAQEILDRGVMTVGVVEGVGWPFYLPETAEGFVPDLIREMTIRLFGTPIHIDWQVLSVDMALARLQAGEFVDLFVPGNAQPTFEFLLAWANEYFINGVRLLVQPEFWQELGRDPEDFKALDGLVVGFMEPDAETGLAVEQLGKEAGIVVGMAGIPVTDNPLASLDDRKVAAFAAPWSGLLRLMEGRGAKYRVVGPLLTALINGKIVAQPRHYQMAVTLECTGLALEVSELLADQVKTGLWLEVYQKWFPEVPPWDPEELLAKG